ncbi:MAG: fibronectin type III domain-containing protein [Acutalibacteraceae bacterium]
MKKALSLFLSILICLSIFTGTVIPASAVGAADKFFSVTEGYVRDGKITYTVNVNGGVTGFGGAVLVVEFDNTVLEPTACTPALANNGTENIKGTYYYGIRPKNPNQYVISYVNTTSVTTSGQTPFFELTFDVIDGSKPNTSVKFLCEQYICTTESDKNINISDGVQTIANFSSVATVEPPKITGAELNTGEILLKWESAEGAVKYSLRRNSGSGDIEYLGKFSGEVLEFNDNINLVSGETYTYYIKSVNSKGEESLWSSYGVSCRYIGKPSNISATNGSRGIDVTWDKQDGAQYYIVYRSDFGSNDWSQIAKLTAANGNTFTDTEVENGKTYKYDVTSVYGEFETDKSEYIPDNQISTFISAPEISEITNTVEGINISWKEVKGSAYYVIYRREINNGAVGVLAPYTTCNVTNYVDINVVNGVQYTYAVQAVSDYGDESAYSRTGYTLARVPYTTVTSAVLGINYVTVNWAPVEDITVSGYCVYAKTQNGEWAEVGKVGNTLTSYNVYGLISGETYDFAVVPYINTSKSTVVETYSDFYYFEAPSDISAVNRKNDILVSWNSVESAVQYKVYRKTLNSSSFSLLATVDGNVLSFADSRVTDGTVYIYKIASVDGNGFENISNETAPAMRISCVTGIDAELCTEGIRISWSSHLRAESYIVLRRTDGDWQNIGQTDKREFVDDTVSSGVYYDYSVIAVVNEYTGGVDENAVKGLFYLAPASTVKITNDVNNYAVVTWSKVDGATSYRIERATVSNGKTGKFSKLAVVENTVYNDKSVNSGTTYVYRIVSVNGKVESLASLEYTNIYLANAKVTSIKNAYTGATITWNAVAGASKYRVYRMVEGGTWTRIANVSGSKTSYTDTGALNNQKVFYTVRAENSNYLSGYKGYGYKFLAAPQITIKSNTKNIQLSWSKISGAKTYYVYRKAPGETSWKKLATLSGTSYKDTNVKYNVNYTYTVKCSDGSQYSGYNPGIVYTLLTPPQISSLGNCKAGIKVTWGKVNGATSYRVYRRLSGSTSWTRLAVVKTTSYTDNSADLKAGKYYEYTVTAVKGSSVSAYNSVVELRRILNPALVSVKSTKNGVVFTWNQVVGAAGYYVYRKTGSGKWSKIATVSGKGNVTYTDKTAKKGTTYTYTVRAYSGKHLSGYNSGLSVKDKY